MRSVVGLALCGALLVGCGGEEEPQEEVDLSFLDETTPTELTYTVTGTDGKCENEGGGYFSFGGQIRNVGDFTESFVINVVLETRSGTRVGEASSVVSDLPAGSAALWDTTGSHAYTGPTSDLICRVASVE